MMVGRPSRIELGSLAREKLASPIVLVGKGAFSDMSSTIGVGILGGGTVGGALARRLIDEAAAIEAKSGLALEVRRIAVRDLDKPRLFNPIDGMLTTDPREVIDDPSVELVVELMGGLEPAGDLVLAALRAGKPVVTGNKELVAARGLELIEAAADAGVSLLFEAAVGGGIPIIRPLSASLAGEHITSVLGIVNGTTNFILTKMAEEGQSYESVLSEAQELGYAEADPAADVEGGDAAAKAAILASLAFGTWVRGDDVYREGIASIEAEDMTRAAQLGYVIKLLAIAEDIDNKVSVRVHPTLVPLSHPMASVRGAQNAVFLEGPAIGELMFSGPGAGGAPTATAVLGDIIDAARELLAGAPVSPKVRFQPSRLREFLDSTTGWYLRLEVVDSPGVLATIAQTFGSNNISIASVYQEGQDNEAMLLLVTHDASEADLEAAVEGLNALEVVHRVAASIRVHS